MTKKLFAQLWGAVRLGRRRLPLIYQSVNAECGLACAAMVAGYWGANIDIHAVRERCQSATFGLTLAQLRAVLHNLNLKTRVVRVEPLLLRRVRTPAILHWGVGHYVILKRATSSFVEIHDPDRGALRLTMEEVDRKLSGWAIEAVPDAEFQPFEKRQRIQWLAWLGFKPRWLVGISIVMLLALASQLIVVSVPYYLQVVVDRIIPSAELALLPNLAILFGVLVALDWLVRSTQVQIANLLGMTMSNVFGGRVFNHLLNLPLAYFEGRSLSDVASRFDSLEELRRSILEDAPTAIISMLLFMLSGLAILRFAPELLVCVAVFLGGYALFRVLYFRRHKQLLADAFFLRTRESSTLYETLQNLLAIKAFSAESARARRWSQRLVRAGGASVRLNLARARLDHTKEASVALESVVSLYLASQLVMNGSMTVGMLVGFIAYKRLLTTSVLSLTEFAFRCRAVGVHLSRLTDIAAAAPEVDTSGGKRCDAMQSLELIAVSHVYPGTGRPTFGPVSFTLRRGERVALVGPSGCGKSTLVKLILGLIPTKHGAIAVNGDNLSDLNRAAWLGTIGVVFQGDKLLSGSLLENICFFDDKPDRTRAREAAEAAHIWSDIERLPMGLDTPLQDDFAILSAGQKQRIFIARALYKRPQLLIMDEGTANLDEILEANILKNLAGMRMTVLHATHRPQVIRDATHVLEVGQVQLLPQQSSCLPANP